MKNKSYRISLLILALVILFTQISVFTLNQYYPLSDFTSSVVFSVIATLACCFLILVQPKGYDKIVGLILIVYAVVNVLFSLVNRFNVSPGMQNSQLYQIGTTLLVTLTHISFLIAILFLMLHFSQPKFSTKFSRGLIGGLLSFSFITLIGAGILTTNNSINYIITLILFLIGQFIFFTSLVCLITEPTTEVSPKPLVQTITQDSLNQLEQLYKRGLITEAEYESRKHGSK